MAIPFYEPRNPESEMIVDQIDGHGGGGGGPSPIQTTTATSDNSQVTVLNASTNTQVYSNTIASTDNTATSSTTIPVATASSSLPSSSSSSTLPSSSSSSVPSSTPDTEEQILAWKILAVAMCKALKEYYLQTATSKDAFTTAVVQILPNGQVQPTWK